MFTRRGTVTTVATVLLAGLPVVSARAPDAREQAPPATLVLRNGLIATVDDAKPQAQALAARGDTLVAVGTNDDIAPYVGPNTKVIDLQGRRAVPGFIEAHGHFTGVGESPHRAEPDAREELGRDRRDGQGRGGQGAARRVDPRARLAPGEVGPPARSRRWKASPPTARLSAASPNNPVVLTHASGHASFANAKAMELAGVTRDTKNPAGGEILKDAKGEPTGLFRETARRLLDDAYARARQGMKPEEREAEVRRQLQLADEEAVSKGITSFQDAGSSFETIDVMKKVAAEGKLGLRLWVMVRDSNERMAPKLAAYRLVDGYDKHLTVRAIKHTLDGALGSRGAWLLEPYSDMPTSTGLETTPLARVRRPPSWPCSTATSSASTRSATAPTARPWTSSKPR